MDLLLNALRSSDNITNFNMCNISDDIIKISFISEIEKEPKFWELEDNSTIEKDKIDILLDFNRKIITFVINDKHEREFRIKDFSEFSKIGTFEFEY